MNRSTLSEILMSLSLLGPAWNSGLPRPHVQKITPPSPLLFHRVIPQSVDVNIVGPAETEPEDHKY